jgi:hypothetical protein
VTTIISSVISSSMSKLPSTSSSEISVRPLVAVVLLDLVDVRRG